MKVLLWLDDVRNPFEADWLVFSPIERPFKTVWVKSYDEFVSWIQLNGLPGGICFDHDLGLPNHFNRIQQGSSKRASRKLKAEEKTGYDCTKWLIDYCITNNLTPPPYNIQSANPIGKENIDAYIKNYLNHKGIT